MNDIKGYEGLYSITNRGVVFSHLVGRELKVQRGTRYKYVRLTKEGKGRTEMIHRLIAKTFIPNPLSKPCVNHIDGDKSNNLTSNLEWCTSKENIQHAMDTGLSNNRGSNNRMAYFKDTDVLFIRYWYEKGSRICELVKLFNSTHSCISDIVKRRSWSYI